jgi:hypothetical protein
VKGCSFSKERKKRLRLGSSLRASVNAKMQKSFASFLQKRRLSFLMQQKE